MAPRATLRRRSLGLLSLLASLSVVYLRSTKPDAGVDVDLAAGLEGLPSSSAQLGDLLGLYLEQNQRHLAAAPEEAVREAKTKVLHYTGALPACPSRSLPAWAEPDELYPEADLYPELPGDEWHLWQRMIHLPESYRSKLARLHDEMMRDDDRVLNVVVLGGSMTGGHKCWQGGEGNKDCAWPRRLEHQLQAYFGEDRATVTNLARGGTQSEVAIGTLFSLLMGVKTREVDIIITDYAVNDVFEFGGNAGHVSHIGRVDEYEKAAAVAESLARGVKGLFKKDAEDGGPLHLMQFTHCPKCPLDSQMLNAMRDVALSQGLGFLDMRHMSSEGGKEWPWMPYHETHPNHKTHQVVSDIAAYAILKEGMRPDCKNAALPSSMSKPELLDQLPTCTEPKSIFDANNLFPTASDVPGIATTGDFALKEDRAEKPGWISEGVDSSITFEVTFGAVPSLTLMYLRSYERMADLVVAMNGRSYTLQGAWDKTISTVQVFSSQAYTDENQVVGYANEENHYGMIGFGAQPFSRHNITITNVGKADAPENTKVKLVTVMTC